MSSSLSLLMYELLQEPQIVRIEMTNVFNIVFQHRNTFYAHTERKTAVFLRIITSHLQNLRMYHPGTENFQPARLLAHPTTFAAAHRAADIHLSAWLREREKAW